MNNKICALPVLALTVLAVTACTTSSQPKKISPVQSMEPGRYQTTTTSKNSSGTDTKVTKTTNVTVDKYGNKKANVETTTTKDPEGLFNKSTSTTSKTVR